jgi:hypothetical protein
MYSGIEVNAPAKFGSGVGLDGVLFSLAVKKLIG